jgi:superfamily II DNA/RNA helicase
MRLHGALAIGGVPINRQIRALAAGVDVLVATPGRLLDLIKSGSVHLDRVEVLVLDEADRMLDMGFIHDIRKIIGKLPRQRQTLLFSATMPPPIVTLASEMLRNPQTVAVTPVASTVERVAQRALRVERAGKAALLADLLRREPIDRALIFTRTKHGADKVARGLVRDGLRAEAIHGNKSQNQRERVLSAFRDGQVRVLVATDIAARGIDVDGVSHVFNFDLPHEPETYVHRIGRTARAGAAGVAISLCCSEEVPLLRAIERLIRMPIPTEGEAAAAPALRQPSRPRDNGHSRGRHQQQRQRIDSARGGGNRSRPTAAPATAGADISSVGFMQQRSDRRKGRPLSYAAPSSR